MGMRFGCQTYTWQMSGEAYVGRIDHIAAVTARAGLAGLEPTTRMLGPVYDDPAGLADILAAEGLTLGAMGLKGAWLGDRETEAERAAAAKAFAFIERFPGAVLVLAHARGEDRSHLVERQRAAIACVNAVAARAAERGIAAAFHPNSPAGSVFQTAEDYRVMFDGLDESVVGYAPDAGHIAAGGMDPVAVFAEHAGRIRHVHFKDIASDGEWAGMGRGMIDFERIVRDLHAAGYEGWVMVEEESPRSVGEPDEVTMENGAYVRERLVPIVEG